MQAVTLCSYALAVVIEKQKRCVRAGDGGDSGDDIPHHHHYLLNYTSSKTLLLNTTIK
jgi:hypothetical protein